MFAGAIKGNCVRLVPSNQAKGIQMFSIDNLSNSELEEMGLAPEVQDDEEEAEFVRANSRCCTDPLCPCPKF